MIEFEKLSANAIACMKFLGDFGPTKDPARAQVKGYMWDGDGSTGKVYLDAGELRELASACVEVADWLQARQAAAAAVVSNPRYVLHPGYVESQTDADRHFIGGSLLAQLYGVNIRECVFGDVPQYREQPGDIHLRPRFDGDYRLPVGGLK